MSLPIGKAVYSYVSFGETAVAGVDSTSADDGWVFAPAGHGIIEEKLAW